MNTVVFQKKILGWHRKNRNRFDFPWRRTHNPYRILVSEIMLQQTQIPRVIPKYYEWLREFPTAKALARAPFPDVLRVWQGLGYNRRARHLKDAAREIVQRHGGVVPREPAVLEELPGIGHYTARAIACFSYGVCEPFIETNIRRVYIHFFFSGRKNVTDEEIMERVAETMPGEKTDEWFSALMDYGREVLGKARDNPNRRSRHYARQSRFEGSRRYVRALIIRTLTASKGMPLRGLQAAVRRDAHARPHAALAAEILAGLAREKLIHENNGIWRIRRT